jgi:agmatine deiminase
MIIDKETDILFYAETLISKNPLFWKEFNRCLNELDITSRSLYPTKDIWCRDYMPIQISQNKYLQFNYSPSYLRKKDLDIRTDVDAVCKALNIEPVKSNIILDGGNVVCFKDKVILTDKIYSENKGKSKSQLGADLKELFEIEDLIVIPHQPYDVFGHSDGMIRFIDEHTVLVNDFSLESESFRRSLSSILSKNKLETIILPYNPSTEVNSDRIPSAKGTYINFLHVGDSILMPIFNLATDEDALNVITSVYPQHNIKTLNCEEIASDGGVLNCIGWNVKFWKPIFEDHDDFYIVKNSQ